MGYGSVLRLINGKLRPHRYRGNSRKGYFGHTRFVPDLGTRSVTVEGKSSAAADELRSAPVEGKKCLAAVELRSVPAAVAHRSLVEGRDIVGHPLPFPRSSVGRDEWPGQWSKCR